MHLAGGFAGEGHENLVEARFAFEDKTHESIARISFSAARSGAHHAVRIGFNRLHLVFIGMKRNVLEELLEGDHCVEYLLRHNAL